MFKLFLKADSEEALKLAIPFAYREAFTVIKSVYTEDDYIYYDEQGNITDKNNFSSASLKPEAVPTQVEETIPGQWINSDKHCIDIVGVIYKEDAEYVDEGGRDLICVKPATLIDGFHANLIVYDYDLYIPESIIIDEPKNPRRVWA